MANNRIYLRCKDCGAEFFLGKRFGEEYYISDYPSDEKPLKGRLNDFYEKHYMCGMKGPDNFEMTYEMEAEYDDTV